MGAYIDVRSAWPTYIKGFVCVSLVGAPRGITVEDAETFLRLEDMTREHWIQLNKLS